MHRIILIAFTSLALWAQACLATDTTELLLNEAQLPPSFSVSYQVNRGSTTLATTQAVWNSPQSGKWLYKSTTTPQGIVALFTKEIVQESCFEKLNQRLLLTEFRKLQAKRNEHIQFNWDTLTAQSQYKEDSKTLSIKPRTFDAFGFHILIMSNITSLPAEFSIPILRKNRLTEYRFEITGREKLKTSAGEFDTLRIERNKDDEEQTTHRIWLATSLHGLPVQYEKLENNRQEYLATISTLEWLDTASRSSNKTTSDALALTAHIVQLQDQ